MAKCKSIYNVRLQRKKILKYTDHNRNFCVIGICLMEKDVHNQNNYGVQK